MSTEIFTDKAFVNAVDRFVMTNEQRHVDVIARKKTKIPYMYKTKEMLYRGMILNEEVVNSIKSGQPLKLVGFSSWTTNKMIAEKFAKGQGDIVKKVEGKGVVFKKKLPENKIILNIQAYLFAAEMFGIKKEFDDAVMEMGIKESEVIVDKGVNLTRSDIMRVF